VLEAGDSRCHERLYTTLAIEGRGVRYEEADRWRVGWPRKEEKEMGPTQKEQCWFLFILNFQANSNLQWFKIYLPLIKKFQINCRFERIK
jgi:hypothetical protein